MANLLGSGLFKFLNRNLVGLLTSKFLGAEIMGLFNIAYNLAIVPSQQLSSVLTSVLTAGYSRLQYQIKTSEIIIFQHFDLHQFYFYQL